jgi:hypothetical protein
MLSPSSRVRRATNPIADGVPEPPLVPGLSAGRAAADGRGHPHGARRCGDLRLRLLHRGNAGLALSPIGIVSRDLGAGCIIDSVMGVAFGGFGSSAGTMTLGLVNTLLEPHAGVVLARVFVLVAIILFIQRRPRGPTHARCPRHLAPRPCLAGEGRVRLRAAGKGDRPLPHRAGESRGGARRRPTRRAHRSRSVRPVPHPPPVPPPARRRSLGRAAAARDRPHARPPPAMPA